TFPLADNRPIQADQPGFLNRIDAGQENEMTNHEFFRIIFYKAHAVNTFRLTEIEGGIPRPLNDVVVPLFLFDPDPVIDRFRFRNAIDPFLFNAMTFNIPLEGYITDHRQRRGRFNTVNPLDGLVLIKTDS